MKKLVLNISLLVFCSQSKSNAQGRLVIAPMLSEVDTSKDKATVTREDCFLMRGYHANKMNLRIIDHFVKHNKSPQWEKYTDYHMTFFKETGQTNIETVKKYIKNRHTPFYGRDDLIYEYAWSDGKYSSRTKYKNGEPIETIYPRSNVHIMNTQHQADPIQSPKNSQNK
jgi:hypothetical protein